MHLLGASKKKVFVNIWQSIVALPPESFLLVKFYSLMCHPGPIQFSFSTLTRIKKVLYENMSTIGQTKIFAYLVYVNNPH